MDATTARGVGTIVGVIRHRLLVNRLADPGEVASRLPSGVRPHVTASGGVIVGLLPDSNRLDPAMAIPQNVRADGAVASSPVYTNEPRSTLNTPIVRWPGRFEAEDQRRLMPASTGSI